MWHHIRWKEAFLDNDERKISVLHIHGNLLIKSRKFVLEFTILYSRYKVPRIIGKFVLSIRTSYYFSTVLSGEMEFTRIND